MKYTSLDPIPADISKEGLNDLDVPQDSNESTLKNKRFYLRLIQKWSLVPFGLFIPLHGINTLVLPLVEPVSAPNEVLMMIREITPRNGSLLIWSGISLHILSGLVLRAISTSCSKTRSDRKNVIMEIESEKSNQNSIGLVGGLSGYFIGINKKLSYNPQVWSGWILTPLVVFHGTIMKWLPKYAGVDIDFDYVKWLLTMDKDYIVKYSLSSLPLISLIAIGTYHIVSGTAQFFRVRNLKNRRKYLNFFLALMSAGVFSVSRLGSQMMGDLDKYYEPILNAIHLS